MLQNSHEEPQQSFYSVYSHESMFDNVLQHSPSPEPIRNVITTEVKMIKVAQSNINLDDGLIENSNSLIETQRRSYETVPNVGAHQSIKQSPVVIQRIIQNIEQNDISAIQSKQEQQQEQSVCLLRQIDCLSVEQVSPAELKEIKKKIQVLRKQQITMQGSLLLANQMLQNAKTRNEILEQQVAKYRKAEQLNSKTIQSIHIKLKELKQNGTNQQKRIFPQFSTMDSNTTLNRLKLLYRQCSLNDSYCIYQNEGYKIQVSYIREKHISQPKMLTLCIKLTAHHHIISKKQFKFGLQIQENQKFDINGVSYQGALKILQFQSWPQGKFNIPLSIHEIDEVNNKHHSHSMLIPLPITHFFEPRMILVGHQYIQAMKKTLSQYSLTISGAISTVSVQKIRQQWWFGTFMSCLGWNQLILFQIYPQEQNKSLRMEVYGKKNGKVTVGLIQFLSFFLVN